MGTCLSSPSPLVRQATGCSTFLSQHDGAGKAAHLQATDSEQQAVPLGWELAFLHTSKTGQDKIYTCPSQPGL